MHRLKHRSRGLRERQVLSAFLLGMMRRLRPDATGKIEVCPNRRQHLTNTGTRQKLKADCIRSNLISMLVERRCQAAKLFLG